MVDIKCRLSNFNVLRNKLELYYATFRDPSAWYHIVSSLHTTQATDTNRIKLYVNGEQLTNLSSPVLSFTKSRYLYKFYRKSNVR